jgi:drug/metabolite transporter (DMT)-like permease
LENKSFQHLSAVLQALLVTFLWSTSFIIIKWGLAEIPPLIFAGLRYSLAFLCFVPFILNQKYLNEIKNLTINQWRNLLLLGILFYTITQGALFIGLSLLPAVSVTLMLNFTPLIVALLGIIFLKEKPTSLMWLGAFLFILGVLIYFYPVSLVGNKGLGLVTMTVGILAYSASSILGRKINRNKNISSVVVTFISMGTGAILLLIAGLMVTGFPEISPKNWIFLLWLAVVNTAFAFTLWNYTLRTITAIESSIINGTMLIQIAILAWIFLGEIITILEGLGMLVAVIGVIFVQVNRKT